MAFLTWGEQYSVGEATIDLQHKRIFELVNELHEALCAGQSGAAIAGRLEGLASCARHHFSYEQRIMASCGYPELSRHRAEHAALARQMDRLCDQLRAGKTTMALEVVNFLQNWLTTHILSADKQYAPYLKVPA